MKRIDPREIEDFDAAVAEAVAAAPALVPLTTTGSDGLPALVWDDDDNLMMVEVSR